MKKEHLLSFLLLFCWSVSAAQTIRYVKENGTGNGTTWAAASGDVNGNDVVTGSVATLSITCNNENRYPIVLHNNYGPTPTNSSLDGLDVANTTQAFGDVRYKNNCSKKLFEAL